MDSGDNKTSSRNVDPSDRQTSCQGQNAGENQTNVSPTESHKKIYDSEANLEAFHDSFSEKSIRNAFIRKVYSLLMIQLAITTAAICLFIYEPRVKVFAMKYPETFWIALIMTIVLLIPLACCPGTRRCFPCNLIFLFLFTIFESFLLGLASSQFETKAVMLAVGICTVICLGLTIFAFQTKIDFTMCSGFLFVSLLIFICFGFVAALFPGQIMQAVYASAGALIFSLYFVYDTQMMMGGNHKYSLSPEEYIFATLTLYLDIINLFLNILQFIGAVAGDE